MSKYKKAARAKLKFQTVKGNLTVEQLFDLDEEVLDSLAVELEAKYKESGGKSFLNRSKSTKDKTLKLQFDIVLDVLETIATESTKRLEALDKKKFNDNIDRIIAKKEQGEKEEMSIDELKALKKK